MRSKTQRPLGPSDLLKKGLLAAKNDRPAQTVFYLGSVLRQSSGHYSFWYFYGQALGEMALYRQSERAFRTALKLSRGRVRSSIWSEFGEMLEASGKHKSAEHAHKNATRAAPEKAGAWIRRGAFLAKRGRLAEAEACHRKATTLRDGPIDEAHLNLGYVLRAQGRYGRARTSFQQALELCPNYPEAKAALRDVDPLAEG